MSLHVRAVNSQSQPPATPADNSFRQRSSESGKKSTSLAARVQRLADLQEVTKQLYEVENAINMTKHQMVKHAESEEGKQQKQIAPTQQADPEPPAQLQADKLVSLLQSLNHNVSSAPKLIKDDEPDLKTAVPKLGITPIDRSSPDKLLNSMYLFHDVLESVGLMRIAYPEPGDLAPTAEQSQYLRRMVNQFTKGDPEILTDMRTAYGVSGGPGEQMFQRLLKVFVNPKCNDITDPENELAKFAWQKIFNGDGDQTGAQLNMLWSIISRLPDGRGGSTKYWLNLIFERMPPMLHSAFDKQVRQTDDLQQRASAASDKVVFAVTLASAINALRRSHVQAAWKDELTTWGYSESEGPGFRVHQDTGPKEAWVVCSGCSLDKCPKGKWPDAKCHGKDRLSEQQVDRIKAKPQYHALVAKKRAELGASPLPGDDKPAAAGKEAQKPAVKSHTVDPEVEAVLNAYCPEPDEQEAVQIHAVAEAGRTEEELQALLNKYSPAFYSNEE